MIEIINLEPHDPIPEGPGPQVVVLRRFEEDNPAVTTIEILLTGRPAQTSHPRRPDGTSVSIGEAIEAAGRVAAEEGIGRVFVLDRAQGGREKDILRHHGDHSVHMELLSDTDEEDGVSGSDMRDTMHRSDTPPEAT